MLRQGLLLSGLEHQLGMLSSHLLSHTPLKHCADTNLSFLQGKHQESERELQRHQESYMRREEQLQARLSDLEQRLQQAGGQGSDVNADADAVTDVDSSSNVRCSPSGARAALKAHQPLTMEAVQQQVRLMLSDTQVCYSSCTWP